MRAFLWTMLVLHLIQAGLLINRPTSGSAVPGLCRIVICLSIAGWAGWLL